MKRKPYITKSTTDITRYLFLTVLFCFFLLTNTVSIASYTSGPRVIEGYAEYFSKGNADGALVEVKSELSTVTTLVGPEGGWSSGYWQVDVGPGMAGSGPDWPVGTSFTVNISINGWNGSTTAVTQDPKTNLGTIILFSDDNSSENKNDVISYPVAIINNGLIKETVGVSIPFNASRSYDPEGSIVGYRWDFSGDGIFDTEWSEQSTQSYVFDKTGIYSTVLQVKNNHNSTNSTSTLVYIMPIEPFIELRIPETIETSQAVTFEFKKLVDFNSTNITWMIDDDVVSNNTSIDYVFDTAAVHNVKIYVEDEHKQIHHDVAQIHVETREEPSSDDGKSDEAIDTIGFELVLLFFSIGLFLIIKVSWKKML